MDWEKVFKNKQMGTLSSGEALEYEFWYELLGNLILDEQEEQFKADRKAAHAKAKDGSIQGIADRDAALKTLEEKKRAFAERSNTARALVIHLFQQELEQKEYSDARAKELKEKYTNMYNEAIYKNAIKEFAPRIQQTTEGLKAEYFRRFKLAQYYKHNTQQRKYIDNENILAEIEIAEEEKLKKMVREWWAIWIGLKNSKYFSLSCGTTVGGVLLMIAADYGDAGLGIAAGSSPFLVYFVTRANWWLTNQAVPALALKFSDPKKLFTKFLKKLRARPVSTIYTLIASTVVSIVWAGLTYDTTLELTKQLYEKSTLIDFVPGMFTTVTVLFATIMMTVFTAPTIYTLFGLYTEKFIKAFHGPIDEKGKDNDFHLKNIDKSFEQLTQDAVDNGHAGAFKTTYRVIMGVGVLLATAITFFLQQLVMGESLTSLQLPNPNHFLGFMPMISLLSCAAGVGTVTFFIFSIIDHVTKPPIIPTGSPDPGINKAMLYKALFVLGVAALIGTFAQVMASNHIMENVFTKWMGATSSQAGVLNIVFTMGIGFLGAAGFYFGSAIDSVKRLFNTKESNTSDLKDPTGRNRQPDFSPAIYAHKNTGRKILHRATGTANIFDTDPTREEFNGAVYLVNTPANGLAPVSAADSVAAGATYGLAAGLGSLVGNLGAKTTTPMALPNTEHQKSVVDMLRFTQTKNKSHDQIVTPSP